MAAVLNALVSFIEGLLSPFMPADIYERLTFVYDVSLLAMAAGVILLLLSVVCVIITVMVAKKHTRKQLPATAEE